MLNPNMCVHMHMYDQRLLTDISKAFDVVNAILLRKLRALKLPFFGFSQIVSFLSCRQHMCIVDKDNLVSYVN